MRGRLAIVIALAACGGGNGLHVEVATKGTGAASVVLYIADSPCTTNSGPCPTLTPEGFTDRMPGNIYLRFDNNTYQTTVARDGVAAFRVTSPESATVQIVAVGFDAGGTPVATRVLSDVKIPGGAMVELTTTLQAAQIAMQPIERNNPQGNYVAVWNSTMPASPTDCVLAETWANGAVQRMFVVPRGDEDCDGWPTGGPQECDPLYFKDPGTSVQPSHSTCAMHYNNQHTCYLGGPTCIDGLGVQASSCVQVAAYDCLPTAVCEPPIGAPSPCSASWMELSSCLGANIVEHVDCTINGSASVQCPAMSTTLDFGPFFPIGSPKTCSDVKWSPPSLVSFNPSSNLPPPFDPGLQTQNPQPTTTNPCPVPLMWDGTPISSATIDGWTLADVIIDDTHSLIVPVHFLYNGNAAACGMSCTTTIQRGSADNITQCAL